MKLLIPLSVHFFLLLSMGSILFVTGCKSDAQTSEKTEKNTPTVVESKDSKTTEEETKPSSPKADNSSKQEKIAKWASKDKLIVRCSGNKIDLAGPIAEISQNIEMDSLDYNVEAFSDCSGIFHRVLDSLKTRCPKHDFPDKAYRSSRDIGKWYFEQDQFIRVKDPLSMSDYIMPGAVMLYGGRGMLGDSISDEALFVPGGITHVGVVVSVKKDDEGIVTGYSLFHGQRPGKKASTTHYHRRTYRNRPNNPAYGNGSQPWVGVAPIVRGK